MVAFSQGRISSMREIWSGIDLHGVQIISERGVAVVDDALEAASFIRGPNGVTWIKAPDALRCEIADLLETLAPQSAFASFRRERFAPGTFFALEATVEIIPDGFVGLRWDLVASNFSLRCPPMWETTLFDPVTEIQKVARLLRGTAAEMRTLDVQRGFKNFYFIFRWVWKQLCKVE